MKLAEYLRKNNITHGEFACMVGVQRPHITHILNGRKNPSIELAVRIEDATNGKVTLKDLMNPEAPSRLKKRKKDE